MKNLNRDSFSRIHIVLAIVVILALGVTGWYVLPGKDKSKTTSTPQTSAPPESDKSDKTEKTYTTPGSIASGRHAYVLKFPDGWKLTKAIDADTIIVTDMTTKTGQPVTVHQTTAYDSDAFHPLIISVNDKTNLPSRTGLEPADFGKVDGHATTNYVKEYTAGEPLGITDAKGGEKNYIYDIDNGDSIITVSYSLEPGQPADLNTIEALVRSISVSM